MAVRVLDSQAAGQADQRGLGHGVGGLARVGHDVAGHRGGDDDRALALFQHVRDGGLTGVPHALDVDVDVEVAGFVAHLLERGQTADAGVAAGHVEGAECLLGLGGRVDHLLLVGHVGHHGDDLGVRIHAADAVGGLVHVRVEVDHADLRAVLDVRLRNALAESGRGAGDDGDLAFELALNHGDNSFVC